MNNNTLLRGALLLLTCLFATYAYLFPPDFTPPTDVTCDPITMPKALVKEMIENYRKNQLVAIQNDKVNGVDNDAHSVWFDLGELETFIATIHCKTKKTEGLGIRFYYAAYSDTINFDNKGLSDLKNDKFSSQYGKKHTLIMIPTTNIDGVNKDFNPEEDGKEETSGEKMLAKTSSSDAMAKNHGALFPPGPTMDESY